MAPILRVVDSSSDATIYWDFHDSSGANNPYGVRTSLFNEFDQGPVLPQRQIFVPEPPLPGGSVLSSQLPLVEMNFRMKAKAPAADANANNLFAGISALGRILNEPRDKTILWIPDGATENRYVDFEGGNVPVLLHGQGLALLRVLQDKADHEGLDIFILRHPGFRGPHLDGSMDNMLDNPTFQRDSTLDGVPDGWTSGIGTHSIQQADFAYQNSHTAAGTLLSQTVSAAAAETWSAAVEVRRVSGSGTARVVFSTVGGTGSAQEDVTSSAWTLVELTITTGTGATGVSLQLQQQSPSGTTVLQFRLPRVAESSTAPRFVTTEITAPNDGADAGSRCVLGFTEGDVATPAHLKIEGDTGAKLQEVLVALQSWHGGHRWITDYDNETKWAPLDADAAGWDVTHSNDTSPVGGNARIAYTTDSTVSKKRIRITRTTKLDSLRGEWDVYLRCQPTAVSVHYPKLGWSPSTADPPVHFNKEVKVEVPENATSFSMTDVNLGRVKIPQDTRFVLGGLGLEVHSRRASGTGNLDCDGLFFVPVDEMASTIYVPWAAKEVVLGSRLVEPTDPTAATLGTVEGDFLLLTDNGDTGAEPPPGGRTLPAGRHRWTFRMTGRGDGEADVRVRRVGAPGTNHVQLITGGLGGFDFTTESYVWILEADISDSASYHGQVEKVSGGTLALESIEHEFLPYISANQSIHGEPEHNVVHKLDSAGNLVQYLKTRGDVPIWLPPGPFALSLIFADVSVQSEGRLNSVGTRSCPVTFEYAPRWNT